MTTRECKRCGESIESGYSICWHCGTHIGGSPPDKDFVPDSMPPPPASEVKPRDLTCLRCGASMTAVRRMRFHESTRMEAFLYGGIDQPFFNREPFDIYACEDCGKVEFFLAG